MNVKRTIATMAAIASAAGASHALAAAPDPNASYTYRILNAPTSGDERGIRNLGLQPEAQSFSDKLFQALQVILGGQAPMLNFVPTGSPLAPNGLSTNLTDRPGAPLGTINATPLAVEGLINPNSPIHGSVVNGYTHEDAHTRQTLQVLSDLALREGSAQAFADLVTPEAAFKAGIPYKANPAYDGQYAADTAQAAARGNDWITGGQFGHPGVPWP